MELRKVARSLLLVLVVLAVILVIIHAILPPFWGNQYLAEKVVFVENAEQPFDRLFIGSSHIYHQLSPRLLDSALADGGKSFNLGYAATYAPEAEILCEYLLTSKDPVAKEIYVEVSPFNIYDDRDLRSPREWYMLTAPVWWKLVGHAWGMHQDSFVERIDHVKGASIALVKSTFLPGLVDQLLNQTNSKETLVFGPDKDGFVPLEWEIELPGANPDLAVRRVGLKKDSTVLSDRSAVTEAVYQNVAGSNLSLPYREMLIHLMDLGDERGIKVIYILAPLVTPAEVVRLFQSLPPDRRIDLCDPVTHPEFYITRNAFDKGHLNNRGSRLFTLELAKEIQRLRTSETPFGLRKDCATRPNASP